MTEGKTYVCAVCGNEVELTKNGGGTIICCGQEMAEKAE